MKSPRLPPMFQPNSAKAKEAEKMPTMRWTTPMMKAPVFKSIPQQNLLTLIILTGKSNFSNLELVICSDSISEQDILKMCLIDFDFQFDRIW